MMIGDRIWLDGEELRAALAAGMVEPHGVDGQGKTIYLLTRAGALLTGAGQLNIGSTACRIQKANTLLFGRGPTGLA